MRRFESSVIPYGSETKLHEDLHDKAFESSAIPYGSETRHEIIRSNITNAARPVAQGEMVTGRDPFPQILPLRKGERCAIIAPKFERM